MKTGFLLDFGFLGSGFGKLSSLSSFRFFEAGLSWSEVEIGCGAGMGFPAEILGIVFREVF